MQDADIVNEALPDYIGFIFAESKRKIYIEQAFNIKKSLNSNIKTVGVFVNAGIDEIKRIVGSGAVDLIQLHGDEDSSYISALKRSIRCPVIKAVRVQNSQQISAAQAMPCDYLLLDTYHKDAYGGTGQSFDYSLIPKLEKPYFLAGGLSAQNIKKAAAVQPYCLDISSGVETDGVKDVEKVNEIIRLIREE